jgi:hypothetical protein
MTKTENIIFLFKQLGHVEVNGETKKLNNGSKTKAVNFMSSVFGVSSSNIRTNYLSREDFPERFTNPTFNDKEKIEGQLDKVITYLQRAIKQQNIK